MSKQYNQITFLGTGTSTGTPIVGCTCPVCNSDDPKDNRLRCSIFIKSSQNFSFIVDTGPDLRTQLLNQKITSLDFAIITHPHADHLHGIDDLRPFTFIPKRREFPAFCNKVHHKEITQKFPYIFDRKNYFSKENPYQGGGLPLLNLYPIEKINDFDFSKEDLEFFLLPHGSGKTMGFRHSKMAYIIDCHEIPQELIEKLQKDQLELLIIDCVQPGQHPSHLDQEKCFRYIEQIAPEKAFLTHMNHEFSHRKLEETAKQHFSFPVAPAYDGLIVEYN